MLHHRNQGDAGNHSPDLTPSSFLITAVDGNRNLSSSSPNLPGPLLVRQLTAHQLTVVCCLALKNCIDVVILYFRVMLQLNCQSRADCTTHSSTDWLCCWLLFKSIHFSLYLAVYFGAASVRLVPHSVIFGELLCFQWYLRSISYPYCYSHTSC